MGSKEVLRVVFVQEIEIEFYHLKKASLKAKPSFLEIIFIN